MLKQISELLEKIQESRESPFLVFRFGVLALIIGAAFCLKLTHLTTLSLDSDEIFSVNYSKIYNYNPINFSNPHDDGNPPLHFIVIKLWSNIFGYTDKNLRILPVFFGTWAFVYFYLIAKKSLKFSFPQIVLASLLFSGSSLLFYYSLNVRPYILLVLTSLGAYFHLNRMLFEEKINKKNLILVNFWVTVGLYNHYSFVIFLAFFLLTMILFTKKKFFNILLYLLPSFILFSPWAVKFLLTQIYPQKYGLGEPYLFWQSSREPLTLFRWFSVLSNEVLKGAWNKISTGITFFLLAVFSIITLVYNKETKARKFSAFFMLISIGLFFVLPVYKVLTIPRYSIFLVPFFYLWFCQTLLKKMITQLIFMVIICVFFLPKYFIPQNHEDWRGAARFIQGDVQQSRNVLVLADMYYLVPVIKYYMTTDLDVGCLKKGDESGECRYSADDIKSFDQVYYVSTAWNHPYDGFIENNSIKQIGQESFPALNVYVFKKTE